MFKCMQQRWSRVGLRARKYRQAALQCRAEKHVSLETCRNNAALISWWVGGGFNLNHRAVTPTTGLCALTPPSSSDSRRPDAGVDPELYVSDQH